MADTAQASASSTHQEPPPPQSGGTSADGAGGGGGPAATSGAAAGGQAGEAASRAEIERYLATYIQDERRRLEQERQQQQQQQQQQQGQQAGHEPQQQQQPGADGVAAAGENEAMRVRRNLFRASLSAIASMNRVRKVLLSLRVFLALAQIAVGITMLALPSSHSDSLAGGTDPNADINAPNTPLCQPSAMLVYLSLHITRVLVNLPADIYLSLSPHRSNRARRPGADGLEARERNRVLGSLNLDRRIAKVSDLLALAHVVLFIVGNYTLYSSAECAKPPARSIPLFWTTFSFLAIDYLSIIEIAILALAVIFFLPFVVFLLRISGIADRLPQPDIEPEHKKISQDTVDKIPLVFYVPAEEEANAAQGGKAKDAQVQNQLDEAAAVPLPTSRAETPQPRSPLATSPPVTPRGPRTLRRDQSVASTVRSERSMASMRSNSAASIAATGGGGGGGASPAASTVLHAGAHRQGPLSRLLFPRQSSRRSVRGDEPSSPTGGSRRGSANAEGISLSILDTSSAAGAGGSRAGLARQDDEDDAILPLVHESKPGERPGAPATPSSTSAGYGRTYPLPYPLHPLPINRATCPICLCDFEEPPDMEPAKWVALERKRARHAHGREDEEVAKAKKGAAGDGQKEDEEGEGVGGEGDGAAHGAANGGTGDGGFEEQRRLEEGQGPAQTSASAGVEAPNTARRQHHRFRIPGRRHRATTEGQDGSPSGSNSGPTSTKPNREHTAEEDDALLADVDTESEALEPLRLMECGHVLHRSCLDEWLTGVSGRCPVCSRPVLKGEADADADADADAGIGQAGAAGQGQGEAAAAAPAGR